MDNKITTVSKFFEYFPDTNGQNKNQLFYRGQGKKRKVLPHVLRGNLKDYEDKIYIETLTECSHEFDRHMTHIDILSKMQHYGVPTRLLDVTTNPLVALFFACNSNPDKDGVVYIIESSDKKIKAYDSDSVSILASLPRFSKKDKNKLKDLALKYSKKDKSKLKGLALKYSKNKAVESFNNSDEVVRRLLHEIKKEKPALPNFILE